MDDPTIDSTIAPLIQSAVDSKVRLGLVCGWRQFFTSASANAFKSLALQTGGSSLLFPVRSHFRTWMLSLQPCATFMN